MRTAEVVNNRLVVTGDILPIVCLTEIGLKVRRAEDNTGRKLSLLSFRTMYAKGLWFLMSFDNPARSAESVSFDIVFASRSGLQEVSLTMPILRDSRPDFQMREFDTAD